MKILGIDPGTATTGFGLIEQRKEGLKALDFGCIKTPAKTPLAERLNQIHKDLKEIIQETKPDVLAVEELFFFKNVKTAISVAQARGVVLQTAKEAGLDIFEFTPLQVKQAVTGYGRADKQQVQKMVQIIFGLSKLPRPDDAADALAVAFCCLGSIQKAPCTC